MNESPTLTHAVAVSPQRSLLVLQAGLLVAAFAGALFLSSVLLFVLEPMFAKMVLPRFGGSPAVWNTCVFFFQATMLAGYGYAHGVTRWLSLRGQVGVHLTLVAAAGFTLPVVIPDGLAWPAAQSPFASLLIVLTLSIGAPFFVVSATAPLLQRWFSRTRHEAAQDPYFLYGASNLGSMIALLGYPFVIEPRWPLAAQSSLWTAAYVTFAVVIAACGLTVFRRPTTSAGRGKHAVSTPLSAARRGSWVLLSFVPSSLLLGVTTFLSTDVAAMPLLWTVPLALYLLTFVIAFAPRRLVSARVLRGRVVAAVAIPLIVTALIGLKDPATVMIPLHLAGFFVCALTLHQRLADDRPEPAHLTEFYLWLAVGGLCGGTFNTLVAPLLFSSVVEYPLALALAVGFAARPRPGHSGFTYGDILLPVALAASVAGVLLIVQNGATGSLVVSAGVGIVAILCVAAARRPQRFGAGLALTVLAVSLVVPRGGDLLYVERTFFGVHRVTRDASGRHRLFHGSTLHGEQRMDAAGRAEPLTYFHRTGPIGQTISALSTQLQRVAVVGLGAGSLAAYAGPAQQWTFFEIDPAVERIARSPEFFSYLSDCAERCRVILGDARLSLARTPEVYDLLILDAFSSDAIPAHLVTSEAVALYLSRLSEHGVIAFHVSNRHLDLRPVLGSLTAHHGLHARVQLHRPSGQSDAMTSLWVIAGRELADFGRLATDSRWQELTARSQRLWTDDYSDLLSILATPR